MNSSIRIAKELVRLAKSLVGATVHHYIDFTDDTDAINEACEKRGCTVKYKFTKLSMVAKISNGFEISAKEDYDEDGNFDLFYYVTKQGTNKGSYYNDLDKCIEIVFGDDDYWKDDESLDNPITEKECVEFLKDKADAVLKSLKSRYFDTVVEPRKDLYGDDHSITFCNGSDGNDGYKCSVGSRDLDKDMRLTGWGWDFSGKGVSKMSHKYKSFDEAVEGLRMFLRQNAWKYDID